MATLIKQTNGLLYEDNFSEQSLAWNLSPSDADALEFGENGLRLKHTDQYVIYTITEPELDEYACIVDIDHIPYDKSDIAGVIVLSSNKQYAECQTYMATSPSEVGNIYTLDDIVAAIDLSHYVKFRINDEEEEDVETDEDGSIIPSDDSGQPFQDTTYHYIKCYKKNDTYTFFASPDALYWIEVGSVKYENAGTIGLFIHAADNEKVIENSHCYVSRFDIYKSKLLSIFGIPKRYEFEIHDSEGHTLVRTDEANYQYGIYRDDNVVHINTTPFPMPLKNACLRVFHKGHFNNTLIQYQIDTLYGGDEYKMDYDIRFFRDGEEIDTETIYDLGDMYIGETYVKLTVQNCDYMLSPTKDLHIERYSDYYSGHKPVLIAITENDAIPQYSDFADTATLPELAPGHFVNLFLCLKERPLANYFLAVNDFRFKIVME